MPQYTVELTETVLYSVDVEAKNEEEAESLAKELWSKSEDPTDDFCGQGMGVDCEGVTKIGE